MRERKGKEWRQERSQPSLREVHRSISVPVGASFFKRLFAFIGPGYLIAVGYMDPGNWATDIAAGSAYNYTLLSAVLISSLLAIFLQGLSLKLGIATGRDLAQASRDAYAPWAVWMLWISAEIAIAACDVAEVIGAAIALNLLFHLPIVVGIVLTSADVLLVLALQHRGFRWIEILVITLIATMMAIFSIEIFFAKPDWLLVAKGVVPSPILIKDYKALFIALGILGATVMPHNLYLHSSIVQTRNFGEKYADIKDAIKNASIDSGVALSLALLVNAALLIVAAAVFYKNGHHDVTRIEDAYGLLKPILGISIAGPLFAIALLASGQNSTLTGTMAGQVILEGFTNFKMKPWVRRMTSRLIAIVPSIVVVEMAGSDGVGNLLLWSQVILSAQLSFAVIPLVQFTSDKAKMGAFVNRNYVVFFGWASAVVIAMLNAYLIFKTIFPDKAA